MTAQLDTELTIIADALAHWLTVLDDTIPREYRERTGRDVIADCGTVERLISKIAATRQG